jgi:hypothetical protein
LQETEAQPATAVSARGGKNGINFLKCVKDKYINSVNKNPPCLKYKMNTAPIVFMLEWWDIDRLG